MERRTRKIMPPLMILLVLCALAIGKVSASTDPRDATALRNLRQIWRNTPLNWGDSDDPCSTPWEGVDCRSSRVVNFRLDRNALTGAVPSSIRNLTQLRELHLARNGLAWDIPDLTGMTSLNYVDLSYNEFTTSSAPSWFTNLRSLTVLIMDYVGLTGELPAELFSLPQLHELTLRYNKFNGTVHLANIGSDLRFVDLRGNIITGLQNEPKSNTTTLRLIGNPVCNAQIEDKDFCKPDLQTEGYSTVSQCSNECPNGQANRPRTCKCAQPYAGKFIFRGPLFRDLKNKTRFQRLERHMEDNLKLEEGSVSLQNPIFDDDEYLIVHLEIFPSDGESFDISEVHRLGSALSTQEYIPDDDEWGAHVFMGEAYIFYSGDVGKLSAGVIAGIAAGCGGLLLGLVAVGVYAVRERRKAQKAARRVNPFAKWATTGKEDGSAPHLNGVRFFFLSEVKKCTADFSSDNMIGAGGYGEVYKGKLPSGQLVAIKRAKQGSMQGALEFKTEIELLSRVHHMNLVRLVGFCYDKGEQMLIYEYISKGTLSESLAGKVGIQLSWVDRLKIALGSARGLAYLHELADPPIIHRDVKTTNILLDELMTPKVADFGLSKLVSDAEKQSGQTVVKGTLGYLDPEYFATQQLTNKSDVYSFEVVMLELLTGKKPIEKNRYIVREVRTALQSSDGLKEIIDPVIRDTPILAGLEKFVDVAICCVENSPADRPTMREVVKEIEFILENSTFQAPSDGEIRVSVPRHRYGESTSSQDISSNAFDNSAIYILPTVIEPK